MSATLIEMAPPAASDARRRKALAVEEWARKARRLAWLAPFLLLAHRAVAQGLGVPKINIGVDTAKSPQDVSVSLQILFLLTILSLAPALLIMLTSFTRIIIVLSFTRSALGTQQVPPNAVLIGLTLFLTFFTMAPVINKVNDSALQPFMRKEISMQVALDRGQQPVRAFMFRQTRQRDLGLFVKLSGMPRPKGPADIPIHVLIPAFIISELKTAFTMGFIIFIPFLIIDMVVAVTLMSMGMMMLPPVLVSLPIKILLFVMVDGWHLIARSLVVSFR
ncbi:MAG TPA: flagellar type III secretion system pore protein FliP [Armatimonadota bacterium]|jgi:flagellar biosynthetic protein FliP